MRSIVLILMAMLLIGSFAYGQQAPVQDSIRKIAPPRDTTVKKTVAAADTAAKKKKEPKPPYVHQFRIGFDLSRIAANIMFPSRPSYEIQADYLLRNNLYIVAETGFGTGKIDYENLKYTSSGYFVKFGVDKSFLDIISSKDFDIGFIGLRYGAGPGKRAEAAYVVPSIWGPSTSGTIPAQNYYAHWGEITGGVKVEVFRHIFLGWNARMRFLLNPGVFKELSPAFIPGYGKGDKSTSFDINFYASYAIRWGGK